MVQCQARVGDRRCRLHTQMQFPYCWVHLKSRDGLRVKQSTIAGGGKGLFYVGRNPFPANQDITRYSARQVTPEDPANNSAYILRVKGGVLDSQERLNYPGRYINDKHGTKRRANVRFVNSYPALTNGRMAIPVRTTQRIQPQTELLVNYGDEYWPDGGRGRKRIKR